jgi:hypothetical protein
LILREGIVPASYIKSAIMCGLHEKPDLRMAEAAGFTARKIILGSFPDFTLTGEF